MRPCGRPFKILAGATVQCGRASGQHIRGINRLMQDNCSIFR